MEIIQQLQSTTGLAYISANPIRETCPVCGKAFDLLSADWVYKTRGTRNTAPRYLCSYHCWRESHKTDHNRLRGEKLAQDRIKSGKERDDL